MRGFAKARGGANWPHLKAIAWAAGRRHDPMTGVGSTTGLRLSVNDDQMGAGAYEEHRKRVDRLCREDRKSMAY